MNGLAYIKRFTACLLFILLPLVAPAQQVDSDNRAIDNNLRYESLLSLTTQLSDKEEVVTGRLNEVRKIFATGDDAAKEKAAVLIMELERELFDIRAEADKVASELSEFGTVYEHKVKTTGVDAANKSQKKNLVENDFFRNNLTVDDYEILLDKQTQELKVLEMLSTLKKDYDHLAILSTVYKLAENGVQADSIYSRIEANAKKNELLAGEIGDMWGDIFDTKTYTYNYILDKVGENELLAGQETQMNNLYMLEEETLGEYMYDAPARYALQKILLVSYETRIAAMAGLNSAVDSLNSLTNTTSHINDYFMPKLDLSERVFYDFAPISIERQAKYSSAWKLPEVKIYPRGSVYRVLIGTYTRPPQISAFKGVYPLAQEKKSDGKYYYYAGGYATMDEASAGVSKLKSVGFSNPKLVAWHNGQYDESNTKNITSSASSQTSQTKNNGLRYRIEIMGAENGLNQAVHQIISNGAVGKEISKISSQDDGKPIFVVGSFSNKSLAESLAARIKEAQTDVTLKVVKIE